MWSDILRNEQLDTEVTEIYIAVSIVGTLLKLAKVVLYYIMYSAL